MFLMTKCGVAQFPSSNNNDDAVLSATVLLGAFLEMKLSGIHLVICVAGKVFPDVTRVLVSCMTFYKANHAFWLSVSSVSSPISPSLVWLLFLL